MLNRRANLSVVMVTVLSLELITKRTRTAGDGDLHHASTKNSDGTHHCNHAERIGESNQRATVSFSRRKGGDVDSHWQQNNNLLETTADSVVHEGGSQAEPQSGSSSASMLDSGGAGLVPSAWVRRRVAMNLAWDSKQKALMCFREV